MTNPGLALSRFSCCYGKADRNVPQALTLYPYASTLIQLQVLSPDRNKACCLVPLSRCSGSAVVTSVALRT